MWRKERLWPISRMLSTIFIAMWNSNKSLQQTYERISNIKEVRNLF